MKSFRMRSYYLAPLLVLAVVACAKRDNDFAKKAANNRAGAQKVTDRAGQPLPKDGVNPEVLNKEQTVKDAETKDKKQQATYAGDLEQTFREACKNMISMEADTEKDEEEIVLSDIITKEKQSYVLQSTELFAERTDKETKDVHQMTFTGSTFELPKDFKGQAQDQKTVVTCHNVSLDEAAKQEMSADLILPYDISAEDGAIKVLRQDKAELSSSKKAVASTLYSQAMNLKEAISEDQENKKILIVKHKDSSDITIKIQSTTTDKKTGAILKKTISGTYALKK